MSNLIKVAIAALALVGLYFAVPPLRQFVDGLVRQPSFQQSVIKPSVGALNVVLPDKFQISETDVLGATSSEELPAFSLISEEVIKQASTLAEEQINTLKTTATKAFCQAMIDKIRSDCGLEIKE